MLSKAPGHTGAVLRKGSTRPSPALLMGTSTMFRKEINMVRNKEQLIIKLIYSWRKWTQFHYLSLPSEYVPAGTKLVDNSDLVGVLYSNITVC